MVCLCLKKKKKVSVFKFLFQEESYFPVSSLKTEAVAHSSLYPWHSAYANTQEIFTV